MADNTSKIGLVPVGGNDQKGHGGVRAYFVPSTAGAVAIGDIVTHTVGTNTSAIMGHPAGSLPCCAPETSSVSTAKAITGVVVGIEPENPYANMADQGATGKNRVVWVMDDRDALFKAHAAASQTIKVGGNCGFAYNAPAGGISGVQLTSTATTQGLPLRVVGVIDDPKLGDAVEYLVRINSSTEANSVTGLN